MKATNNIQPNEGSNKNDNFSDIISISYISNHSYLKFIDWLKLKNITKSRIRNNMFRG